MPNPAKLRPRRQGVARIHKIHMPHLGPKNRSQKRFVPAIQPKQPRPSFRTRYPQRQRPVPNHHRLDIQSTENPRIQRTAVQQINRLRRKSLGRSGRKNRARHSGRPATESGSHLDFTHLKPTARRHAQGDRHRRTGRFAPDRRDRWPRRRHGWINLALNPGRKIPELLQSAVETGPQGLQRHFVKWLTLQGGRLPLPQRRHHSGFPGQRHLTKDRDRPGHER